MTDNAQCIDNKVIEEPISKGALKDVIKNTAKLFFTPGGIIIGARRVRKDMHFVEKLTCLYPGTICAEGIKLYAQYQGVVQLAEKIAEYF